MLIRTRKKEEGKLDYNRNALIASVITGLTGKRGGKAPLMRKRISRSLMKKRAAAEHFHLLDGCCLFHFANDDVAKIPQSERRVKCLEMIENTGAQPFGNKEDKDSISLGG